MNLGNLARIILKSRPFLLLDFPIKFQPRYSDKPHPQMNEILKGSHETFADHLDRILKYKEEIMSIGHEEKSDAPHWNNGFLPGLDIIGLYTMIAEYKPKRYMEIGSGNSTRVGYKAKNEHSPETEIISIDPMPRAEIDALADRVIRKPVEQLDPSFVDELEAGDILFVDNSHRILPNSDGMVFFTETLPRLKPGVIVQIHDIYIPFDYPQDMCDRGYSEQYGLAIHLMAAPEKVEVLLPHFYIFKTPELHGRLDSIWKEELLSNVEHHGGSFWFRKK